MSQRNLIKVHLAPANQSRSTCPDGPRLTLTHKAQILPKEAFRREVEKHLTGRETEAWELPYLKLYKSQLTVVEQALETAIVMLGSDKSRGYCLEMICADFLAGPNLEGANSEVLLLSVKRLLMMLLPRQKQQLLEQVETVP